MYFLFMKADLTIIHCKKMTYLSNNQHTHKQFINVYTQLLINLA